MRISTFAGLIRTSFLGPRTCSIRSRRRLTSIPTSSAGGGGPAVGAFPCAPAGRTSPPSIHTTTPSSMTRIWPLLSQRQRRPSREARQGGERFDRELTVEAPLAPPRVSDSPERLPG